MMWIEKVKSKKGSIVTVLGLFGFVGITLFDVAICGSGSLTSKLVRYLEKPTDENQLPLSNVENETETGITQLSPINEATKEPETQTPSQQTDADETRKLEFSRLIGILTDLSTYSARLGFIENNIDLMPDSLSLAELHRILALFDKYNYRLAVIQTFLPRLPYSISLGELNRILALFGTYGYRLKVTRIFRSRLKEDYSESDFDTNKKKFGSIRYKRIAIELLVRKNQKQ